MKKCRQCGTCCRKGGPALHVQDLELLKNKDGIDLTDLVTLRKGEMVYDQPVGAVIPLEQEIIKIKGTDGEWICSFFTPEGNTCGIYNKRPLECQLLFCEDPEPLLEVYSVDRLTRTDILPQGHPLVELIAEHDKKCPMDRVAEICSEIVNAEGEEQKNQKNLHHELLEMVSYDLSIRDLVVEKAGIPKNSLDFFFGRSLLRIIPSFGISAIPTVKGYTLRVNKRS
ncbi:YkgJ family cysteine cluster protein [Maridesulfovibrio bastinii]|uniref:YkgJ family cysteine cluster protein n=1 Tax=Maridesulfovibrio bastinii TaxID=47157 RepID=UPI0004253D07|nr:YkgJ family cysteine cluster protein [Maridesulfovibrio bastinii]